ncbi:hypothetical protein GOP47_0004850 [Adiantum capillus-veneris]|uniref:Flagellar associated protein n=1 Tax=Adiantum capillus-veneris TaxID=13818 RepID=A0A9D4V4T6_ADICA|nr:hypothetical protein GOP47_0004850 [Adiantum capillus-veneris]
MEKKVDEKPWGRFQSTYMREMSAPLKKEDYTCATRHGVRDGQAKAKSDVTTRFKFPTGVSAYEIEYGHGKPPALEDYGDSKQPSNDHSVACASLAGYNTTYHDQSFVLQHQNEPEEKRYRKDDEKLNHKAHEDVSKEQSRHIFGPWNHTGTNAEDIFIQRDRVKRAQKGTYYLPGYMGHEPMHNPPSTTAFDRRSPEKEKMLLYDLDQYSRELWPHYKGHKPQALVNVKNTPSPTKQTTYGYTNSMMQRQQDWESAHRLTKPRIPNPQKRGGTKTFFTQGTSGTTSANGVLMAEKYYSFVRPLEGTLVSFAADKALASRYLE